VLVRWDFLGAFSAGPLNDQAARIACTIVFANCYGFGMTVVVTMGRVLINERIPQQMQGRAFAAHAVLSNLVAILPVLLAGIFADAVGVEPVLVLGGVVALGAAVWSRAQGTRVVPAHAA
jgi:MFS family permease